MPSAAVRTGPEVLGFRDPGGRLVFEGSRVLRLVNEAGMDAMRLLRESPVIQRQVAAGRFISTELVSESVMGCVLEHPRIEFPSYPVEWPAEMLQAAGLLTLTLAEELLEEGLGLKDASPWNVLFRGARPVFVDALSIERRDPLDPLWRPLGQFIRSFVLPLAARRDCGLPLSRSLGSRREGLEPEEVARMAGPLRCLKPLLFRHATLPAWLGRRRRVEASSFYRPRPAASAEQAKFILKRLFRSLCRDLESLIPARDSAWTNYQASACQYTAADRAAKHEFVGSALSTTAPGTVLDVGANQGFYSRLAAERGASVVAIDSDEAVTGRLWRDAAGSGILPLVVNLAEPTPAAGWANREQRSFLNRARGGFDLVMMLAVLHHLAVTSRVPLDEIARLARELTRRDLILEFVPPEDPMFRRLLRGREELYRDYHRAAVEQAFQVVFTIEATRELPDSHRILYQMRAR